MSGLFSGIILFVLLFIIGSFALSVTDAHRQTLRFQIGLFLCAFAVRFAVSIVIYQFGFGQVLMDEDASGWLGGIALMRRWMQDGVGLLELPFSALGAFEGVRGNRGYQHLLGVLFYLTGTPARLPAAIFNGFVGALTVTFIYRLASSLFSPWVAVRVGWLACLFPSLIIWSAQTIKEPVVILLETMALYGCVRLKGSGFSPRHIFLCTLAIVLLLPFRFYAAYIVGGAILVALILPHVGRRKTAMGSALAVMALVLPLLVLSGILAQHAVTFEQFDLEEVEKIRSYGSATAGSGVGMNYDLRTPEGFGLATVIGAAHLLLAPFPWQLGGGSLRMLMTTPELILWWWLFFFGVLPGVWYVLRHRFSDVQPMLFFILTLGFLYSLIFNNIGLAYRQRAQLLPVLLILALVGREQRIWRRLSRSQVVRSEPMVSSTDRQPKLVHGS